MINRSDFLKRIAEIKLTHSKRAIVLLWYYRQSQEFEERSASDLANDLHDEGFPKPNITNLQSSLTKSRFTIKGHRKKTFQIDVRKLKELNEKYVDFLKIKKIEVSDAIIPNDWVSGTRVYLERLVYQINGSYDVEFFDCCAVLCRRLMESLFVEVYISQKRHHEIQNNGVFLPLEKIIAYAKGDPKLVFGRNTIKNMIAIKRLGDTAAHDRTYIIQKIDIDDFQMKIRRVIQELLSLSGIKKV